MFLIVILGATHKRAPIGFAGIAIGLALTLLHLVSIPVTNTSVNPARSTGPALFVGDWALAQLWLFWVVPIVGAVLAGSDYRALLEGREKPDITGTERVGWARHGPRALSFSLNSRRFHGVELVRYRARRGRTIAQTAASGL